MNNTDKIADEILSNFSADKSFSRQVDINKLDNMFNPHMDEFKKHKLNMPWYLKPFKGIITNIAYKAFCAAKPPTIITFKRPSFHKEGNNND